MSSAVAPGGDPGKEGRAAAGIPVVPAFDGYRAYAILGIVALHLVTSSGLLAASGPGFFLRFVQGTFGQAIDVLFVISGFVVFLPTVARRGEFGSVGAYALRRAARLAPAYWLVLAIALVLVALIPTDPALYKPGVGDVAVHAAFLQTPWQLFSSSVPLGFGVDGAVWTLSLEVTFYLLLPLIAGWYYRRPFVGLAVAAALTAAWHEAFVHFDRVNDVLGLGAGDAIRVQFSLLTQFPFFAFSFAAGMTGAWVYVRLRDTHPAEALERRAAACAAAAVLALALFAYLIGADDGALIGAEVARRSPLLAIGFSGALAAAMVAVSLAPRSVQLPFSNTYARRLGDISYGIFLVHMIVVTFAVHALGTTRLGGAFDVAVAQGLLVTGDGTVREFLVLTAIVVPISVAYGWASARYVEQPIRRWARRYGRRVSVPPAGPEPDSSRTA